MKGLALFSIIFGLVAAAADRPNVVIVLADNWAWPHASIAGDPVVKTPNFDRIARSGLLFENAFCQVPSCSPARAVLLTGQAMHRLGPAANLWGDFTEAPTYTTMLKEAGYAVGFEIKGWAPGMYEGNPAKSNSPTNPAGTRYKTLDALLKSTPADQPICYWFGSHEPHRPWNKAADKRAKIDVNKIKVPPYLPDHPVVRNDIADYYAEVELFDQEIGEVEAILKQHKRLENTLLIVMGDNGWQQPRGLANVYDVGVRTPMAMVWPGMLKNPGRRVESFVSFEDLAPTILGAAGLEAPSVMTGQSLLALIRDEEDYKPRKEIFLERERHANVRAGDLSYPCRAVRTHDFLYIRNLEPNRWPAGDPKEYWAVGPYGDVDAAPTKDLILANRDQPGFIVPFVLGFAKRPAEELYDLRKDPWQLTNKADDPGYAKAKARLSKQVSQWMRDTNDPRFTNKGQAFDKYAYYGGSAEEKRQRQAARARKK
jgi:arylsulfatase A-like enzyme